LCFPTCQIVLPTLYAFWAASEMREAVPRPDSTFRMRGWAIGFYIGVSRNVISVRQVVIQRDNDTKRVSSSHTNVSKRSLA
jgi:hypothetical protein